MSFFKHDRTVFVDLSSDLRDATTDWKTGLLRTLAYHLDVTAFAVDALNRFLAIGTSEGLIHIIGGHGVESKLTLPELNRIKLLQFAVSLSKLVCVDEHNRMYVWDLTTTPQPKLEDVTRFGQSINSLALSPSHTHAFVALESGEIKTYDLLCRRKSPYVIPNMWTLYEKKMLASGLDVALDPGSQIPVEVVIHPRDLNLVFVAYSGGIVLADLIQCNTVRVFEYVVPAGAPGGCGYKDVNLFTHRRPPVTAISIHPAGHFFVVGYADGSIAFWAIEDEDQPFLARTIDDLDVNIANGVMLEKHLPGTEGHINAPTEREPIFKLSWSGFSNSADPRGGETALTILGGLLPGDPSGVSVHWLPAFNPSEPPNNQTQSGINPLIREAMRESVLPTKSFFYSTEGITQDFSFIPKDTPHLGGSFDPTSLLLLSEAEGGSRAVEAFQFPPPMFLEKIPSTEQQLSADINPDSENNLAHDLALTLQSMTIDVDPQPLKLPSSLWSGANGIIEGKLMKIDKEAYEILTQDAEESDSNLGLNGGVAWIDDSKSSEAKLAKYQPHQLLVTHHRDLTIRFQDVSGQILLSSQVSPLRVDFPRLLPSLTVRVNLVLADASIATRISPRFFDEARIQSVHVAPDSLECAVVFKSGEVLLYRLQPPQENDVHRREAVDKELILVDHISTEHNQRYHPYFMLSPRKGPVVACGLSDIGFLAVSYVDGSLLIIDMRGPNIMLRDDPSSRVKRHSIGLHLKGNAIDTVKGLSWTVNSLSTDPGLSVRLLAVNESGLSRVFSLARQSNSWIVSQEVVEVDSLANILPGGSFVIDSKIGTSCKADRTRLSAALQPSGSATPRCFWVVCNGKGAKCTVDINGERIWKADWSSKHGVVRNVEIVHRNGSHALVVFTDKSTAVVYSLPHLEYLHNLPLPSSGSNGGITTEETGDYIEWIRRPHSSLMKQATLATLFDIRRVYELPNVDFTFPNRSIPPQPQPVSVGPASLLVSWFGYKQSMTGDQVDTLLAGPDRPIPVKQSAPTGSNSRILEDGISGASATLKSAQDAGGDLYNRLASALSERGQKLGDLEDSFNSLQQGSHSMALEAKKLAAAQTAKRWFDFS